ncbi:e25fbc2a-ca4e-4785-b007-a29f118562d4-CDS [Sclerotinia trifoliorum]|uniref:E25fbc2a-ca4e-4785-b007-a29f118562d4-CDS n=1 Tax=Sclerotinia trifoliorum TaxID=28548 RepID=A0A8H2W508_9HELO|nr:e25fbc2a-ca4e-4785-b007-a29f118562d4-CDS [Sclerotinia trifoliorum]
MTYSTSNLYSRPEGVHAVPIELLDLRPDSEIDCDLLHPSSVSSDKNIWFFWHNGFLSMHHYAQRNIRAWHRRFSKQGWTIRVLDRQRSSPFNVANFLNISCLSTFPRAFADDTIGGDYGLQHTSDLVRFPLLLKYGGVYADVGMMQIGDLDRMWRETIDNNTSPFEILSYNAGTVEERCLTNYFLASKRNNPMVERCHKLLLALWAADGGKTSTKGMHSSPLLRGVELIGGSFTIEEDGNTISAEDCSKLLTDYIIQGQTMTMVMRLIDENDNWNGPKYSAERVYAIEYMEGSQLINELTVWDGRKAFHLMSLFIPREGEVESPEQKEAREIVEACLKRSFGFKLAHGLILRVFGETLGSLWRKHDGSDIIPGTYAGWLRHGMIHWTQDELPPRMRFQMLEPIRRGPLLGEN